MEEAELLHLLARTAQGDQKAFRDLYDGTAPQLNAIALRILRRRSLAEEAVQDLLGWISSGQLNYQVDLQEGFENIPNTLNRLFTGKNIGKQLLKIADPS